MNEEKRFITKSELATLLGVSVKFVDKHTAQKRIVGTIKVGGQYRYNLQLIEKRLLNSAQFLLEK